MYRTSGGSARIEEIIVTRATDKSVWYMRGNKEIREVRWADSQFWFETKQEAIDFCRKHANRRLERAQAQIDREREILKELDDLSADKKGEG